MYVGVFSNKCTLLLFGILVSFTRFLWLWQVLQNRFYADTNFDWELRRFCRDRNIKYQSFWTLSGNRKALATPEVKALAEAKGLTAQTYMYAFLMSLGYATPLSGTTSPIHMAEDVAVMERMQGGETMFTEHDQKNMFKILRLE